MSKSKIVGLFGLLSLLFGAIAGAIVWIVLKLMNAGIDLIWAPGSSMLWYNIIICLVGALLIGLWQRKFGILPHNMEQVFGIMKKDGKYPYDKLGVIAVAALLPLIFGGALGPEAGLSGLIAGLCYWVGDTLKNRGDALAEIFKKDDTASETLAETGISMVLSVIFRTPLVGISENLEPGKTGETVRERLLQKKGRIFLYCMGVLGGLLAFYGLGTLLKQIADACGNAAFIEFANSGGLPRFTNEGGILGNFDFAQWKWAIPLILAGIVLALIYQSFDKITGILADKVANYRIVSCMIAGICVAVMGFLLPDTMFSGEHQLGTLIRDWQSWDAVILILTAVGKLLLAAICINFGWRGGSIFPIIFSGAAAAFGLALFIGMDGAFAAAILISAMYAYISRKPLTSVLLMLLCFPISYLIPMFIAAFVASKIPTPFRNAEEAE